MKKIKLLSIASVLFIILSSFKGEIKPFKNTEWIPKDFDARTGVLLVQTAAFNVPTKQNEKVTADLKEIMQQNFPFKYQFASVAEIAESDKYADKDKYRWALASNSLRRSANYVGTNPSTMVVNSVDYHIYDRKNDKEYEATGHSNSFPKAVFAPTVVTLVKYSKEQGSSK